MYNIILVQEAMYSSLSQREKRMLIKIDFVNAFDKVRYSFMYVVLSSCGFDANFRNWVKSFIGEPWIAPLINGCATDFFKVSRGQRQGCPLFPLLYVLKALVLSLLLDRRRQYQDLMGVRMTRVVQNINHAQFAGETLLIGGA